MTAKLFLSNSLGFGSMMLANAETVAIWATHASGPFSKPPAMRLAFVSLHLNKSSTRVEGSFYFASNCITSAWHLFSERMTQAEHGLEGPSEAGHRETLPHTPPLPWSRERDVQLSPFWPSAGVTPEAANKPPSCSHIIFSAQMSPSDLKRWTGELPLGSAPPC